MVLVILLISMHMHIHYAFIYNFINIYVIKSVQLQKNLLKKLRTFLKSYKVPFTQSP